MIQTEIYFCDKVHNLELLNSSKISKNFSNKKYIYIYIWIVYVNNESILWTIHICYDHCI